MLLCRVEPEIIDDRKKVFCGVVFVGRRPTGLPNCHERKNIRFSGKECHCNSQGCLFSSYVSLFCHPPLDPTAAVRGRSEWGRWRNGDQAEPFCGVWSLREAQGRRAGKTVNHLRDWKLILDRTRFFKILKYDPFIMTWNTSEKLWDPSRKNEEKAYIWEKK